MRLLRRAQAKQAAGDPVADEWERIAVAIEAGETRWSEVSQLHKTAMPIDYIVRCKAADRRAATSQA